MPPGLRGDVGGRPGHLAGRTCGEVHQRARQGECPEAVGLRDGVEFGESFVGATATKCDEDTFGDIQGSTVNRGGE